MSPELGNPVTKLAAYGIPEWRIKFCSDVLSKASTTETFDRELAVRHAPINWSQALMPVFRPIYQNEPDIKKQVQEILITTGVSPVIIDEYFTSDQPFIVFNLRYEDEIPLEIRDNFNVSAAQVVLNTVKSYLGLTPR